MFAIERGTGYIVGRRGGSRGSFRPLNNKLFVLSDIMKELWGWGGDGVPEKQNKAMLLFLYHVFFLSLLSLPFRLSHYW